MPLSQNSIGKLRGVSCMGRAATSVRGHGGGWRSRHECGCVPGSGNGRDARDADEGSIDTAKSFEVQLVP
jgi:hypothetical protein